MKCVSAGVLGRGLVVGLGAWVAAIGCSRDQSAAQDKSAAATAAVKEAPPPVVAPKATIPSAPKSLGALKIPSDNPLTAEKVALGHKLFFDPRLSADGSRSCYSCHQNEDGTGGHEPMAVGAMSKQLTRHSPIIWNVGYLPAFYWDGRAPSLEAQMKGAWGGGNMGVGADNLQKKADEIGLLPEYKPLFRSAFPGEGATPDTIAQAVASYERTLFCGDTAFDKFFAGDKSALTAEQKQGWEIFSSAEKGNCASCHTPPFFSDAYLAPGGAYHNAGVGIAGKKPDEVDVGRQKVSNSPSDFAAFKTPSLRNVGKSAPYFHDGSAKTLIEAVRFMASGGYKNSNLDDKLTKVSANKLSDADIGALVSFLGALDCENTLSKP